MLLFKLSSYAHGGIFVICNLMELRDWVLFLSIILLKLGEAIGV